jgi:hypothetical protein
MKKRARYPASQPRRRRINTTSPKADCGAPPVRHIPAASAERGFSRNWQASSRPFYGVLSERFSRAESESTTFSPPRHGHRLRSDTGRCFDSLLSFTPSQFARD